MATPTKDLSDEQLKAYSKEHLHYELTMLLRTSRVDYSDLEEPRRQFLINILLASFAIHLRNLLTFLYPTTYTKETDVYARNFFPEETAWERLSGPISTTLDEARNRAHREVGHLTTYRLAGASDDKKWDTGALISELLPILRSFCNSADKNKLDPSVAALIRSYSTSL